ncbi:IS66 family insertion sequence element accessory protein TnpA [Massilia rubra]|uniref:IS66 family insertion sequence element accessory protein TnpA n=1 Tax=Massilia rubra TaxID=2607910 RepID=UPI003F888B35
MAGGMDFWREHVMAIERDGWVSSEYARAHDLSVRSLYYWRAKFRSMAAAADIQSKFVTLNVTPVHGTAPSCVLTIGAVRWSLACCPPRNGWWRWRQQLSERADASWLPHRTGAPVPGSGGLSQVNQGLVGAGRAGTGP